MTKRVFLYATGSDYSAMDFSDNFNVQQVYEEMVQENVTTKTIDTDEYYIELKILEFGAIDDKFISFIQNNMFDYDKTKASDFFEVTPPRMLHDFISGEAGSGKASYREIPDPNDI